MFVPPRCPNPACDHHLAPKGRFYVCIGAYSVRCRTEPVPRFRCRTCRQGFSRQTFRYDYRDRRPDANETVFLLLCSGVGLRQIGRVLKIDVHSVQGKQRKMARTFGHLHHNLCPKLPPGRTYVLDEEETFEMKSIRPLTVPVVIDKEHWFVVATGVGSIRRRAKAGSWRRRLQDKDELANGKRPDQSRGDVQHPALVQQVARRPRGDARQADGGGLEPRLSRLATDPLMPVLAHQVRGAVILDGHHEVEACRQLHAASIPPPPPTNNAQAPWPVRCA